MNTQQPTYMLTHIEWTIPNFSTQYPLLSPLMIYEMEAMEWYIHCQHPDCIAASRWLQHLKEPAQNQSITEISCSTQDRITLHHILLKYADWYGRCKAVKHPSLHPAYAKLEEEGVLDQLLDTDQELASAYSDHLRRHEDDQHRIMFLREDARVLANAP